MVKAKHSGARGALDAWVRTIEVGWRGVVTYAVGFARQRAALAKTTCLSHPGKTRSLLTRAVCVISDFKSEDDAPDLITVGVMGVRVDSTTGQQDLEPEGQHKLRLENGEDELAHLVCCREMTRRVTFCGEVGDSINLAATVVCTMCIEVAAQGLPDGLMQDPPVCPLDRRLCPDEHEIDRLILREVSP